MTKEIVQGLDKNRTTDLILINSPLRNYDLSQRPNYTVLPPLGLGYIATESSVKGHNVGLLDAEYHTVGITEIAKAVNNLRPRYIGINMLTPTRELVMQFATAIDPDLTLVVGGPHATALPKRSLNELTEKHVRTILITGEAEFATLALLNGQSPHDIPGIYWLDGDDVRCTPGTSSPQNLDEITLLDRRFLAGEPFLNKLYNSEEAHIVSGRGCPFNCTFCAGARENSGLQVRLRNPTNLTREIGSLVVQQDKITIRFIDDLFILTEKRIKEIFQTIDKSGIPSFFWDANGRANILARFSDSFFDYLKDRGAHEIAIGIESGSDRLRKMVDKRISEEAIRIAADQLTKRQIHTKGYFIIGFPTEAKEETFTTLNLAQELVKTHNGFFIASIFIFRPYPGTRIWNELLKQKYQEEDLLNMEPVNVGQMARNNVITKLQFAELDAKNLLGLLDQYNKWQDNFLGTNFFA